MCKGPEPMEFGIFKKLNEDPCVTATRNKRRFGKKCYWRNRQEQITQGPAGYIKNLGLYHKIKRKTLKGFNERSSIKLNLEKITSATL